MAKITRRSFVGIMAASTTALSMPSIAFGALPRVVVIGGGRRRGLQPISIHIWFASCDKYRP